MAAILRFWRSFKLELVLEVEYYTNIGHATPYIWAFVRRSSWKIDRVMTISKFDLLFFISWPSYLTFDQ